MDRRLAARADLDQRDQILDRRIQQFGRDAGRQNHSGSFVDRIIGVAKAKRAPFEASTTEKNAEPLSVPGRRAGERVVASKFLGHAPRDGVMRLAFVQESAARNMVDRLRSLVV